MPPKTPNALLHGALDALILKTLTRGPSHGYAIARFIEETSGDAVLVEDGSLYPALYRLERRGWVEAEWGMSELGRRAKLYRLTDVGPRTARRGAGHLAAVHHRRLEGPAVHMKRSLRSWLWRVPLEREVDEELALHVEMRTRELVERGMDPAAARELALSRLGDVARLKRTMTALGRKRDRDMRLTQWLDELRSDLKFAIRQLKGSPAFTLVATLTLALGIGANSAIFALVDATLLRPLPFGNPDRLVSIWEKTATIPQQLRLAAQHARLEDAQPHVRRHCGLHAERRRHGDGRRRRQRRDGIAAVGHVRDLRRPWRHADCRPDVLRRGRGQARQRRS